LTDDRTNLERILQRVPDRSRVVAETVATCALAEFNAEWPEDADDMAAIVCGRWMRTAPAAGDEALSPADAHYIDRVINECYCALDGARIDAANELLDALYKGG
jgi:hypothetical protein